MQGISLGHLDIKIILRFRVCSTSCYHLLFFSCVGTMARPAANFSNNSFNFNFCRFFSCVGTKSRPSAKILFNFSNINYARSRESNNLLKYGLFSLVAKLLGNFTLREV